MAVFCVQDWASPVESAKDGATAGGSSVRVRVAVWSVRPRTWVPKAMTSAELDGTQLVRLGHIRVANRHFQDCTITGFDDNSAQ